MFKRRLLILTSRFPYPMIGGDRLRILNICKSLAASFDLTLLSLCDSREQLQIQPNDGVFREIHRVYVPRWRSYINVIIALAGKSPLQLAYYRSSKFRCLVNELRPKHDAIVAHLLRTAQYAEDIDMPVILEMTDAISLNYERVASLRQMYSWKNLVYRIEQNRMKRCELGAKNKFDRIWLVSECDRAYLGAQSSEKIEVIPNGVDLDEFPFGTYKPSAKTIVFIGNMTYAQNQDACMYFIRDILPLVRSTADIKFRIVGNITSSIRRRFTEFPNVEVTGRLERVVDGVDGAFCGVNPVRAAAGLQNKVLEYMSLGLPCVSSRVGAGGIAAANGEHFLVYDTVQEAARMILRLQEDPQFAQGLARAGRRLVEEHYDWSQMYPHFVTSIETLLETSTEDATTTPAPLWTCSVPVG